MIIREAKPADAEQLTGVIADAESSGFMMFDPGERKITAEQLAKRISSMEEDESSAILLAESAGVLAGYLFAIGNSLQRTSHIIYVAIGISEKSRGQGVGTKLLTQLDQWAKERNVRRIELTVMMKNRAGLALYQKMGYKIEGIKKNSLLVDGEYIDEYYMAKVNRS